MTTIAQTAAQVFRDYTTDGDPTTAAWQPVQSEIRDLLSDAVFGMEPEILAAVPDDGAVDKAGIRAVMSGVEFANGNSADDVFRDAQIAGVLSSGGRDIPKSELRSLFDDLIAVPLVDGELPIIYADSGNGIYWFDGAAYASRALWAAAVGETFTRSTSKTFIGSDGLLQTASSGVLTFAYDPETLELIGIQIDPATNNLSLRSEQFDNAAWTATNVTVTANAVVAPDGTTTADTLTESGGTAAHEVSQAITDNQTLYVASVFVRAGTGQFLNIALSVASGKWGHAVFDSVNGVVGDYGTADTDQVISSVFIEPAPEFGDDAYRCSVAVRFFTSVTAVTVHFGLAAAALGNTYSATGQAVHASTGKTLHLWGAMVEHNQIYPSAYLPSVGSQGDRAADLLYVASAWDNIANPLTLFVEVDNRGKLGYGGSFAWLDAYTGGTDKGAVFNDQILHYPTGNSVSVGKYRSPAINRVAARFDSTTATGAMNGGPVATTAAGSARVAATRIGLGQATGGNATGSTIITKFGAWNTPVSDAALTDLSRVKGFPVPGQSWTVLDGDPNLCAWPGFDVFDDGMMIFTYVRYNGPTAVVPSKLYYKMAATPAAAAAAPALLMYDPADVLVDAGTAEIKVLANGKVLHTGWQSTTATSPVTNSLKTLTGTRSGSTITWGAAVRITAGTYFGGVATGVSQGEASSSSVIEITKGPAAGCLMWPIFGVVSGDTRFSTGAIFSSDNGATWGNFVIVARGGSVIPMQYNEANGAQFEDGEIVLIIRQTSDAGAVLGQAGFSRVVCPAGLDPRVQANWSAPQHVLDNGLSVSPLDGKPDICALGGDGLFLSTRNSTTGGSRFIGYSANWKRGAAYWPTITPYGTPGEGFYYSQSRLMADGTIGVVTASDGPTPGAPTHIVYQQFVFRGRG